MSFNTEDFNIKNQEFDIHSSVVFPDYIDIVSTHGRQHCLSRLEKSNHLMNMCLAGWLGTAVGYGCVGLTLTANAMVHGPPMSNLTKLAVGIPTALLGMYNTYHVLQKRDKKFWIDHNQVQSTDSPWSFVTQVIACTGLGISCIAGFEFLKSCY